MNNDIKFFAAELRDDLPTLDLHGLYPDEAVQKLDVFLFEHSAGQVLKVIYGGGTGVLKDAVLNFLSTHPLKPRTKDLGGSCLILF